jgi:uncharacterized protein (DUF433 family)
MTQLRTICTHLCYPVGQPVSENNRRYAPGRQSTYWPLIVWRTAMDGADAVRSAAGDRSAYASGVAYERISIDPNRMSGLPCIRDTRVTVSAVLGQFAAGLTIPELLVDFPYLDWADVLAALEFAAAAVQERELP